jgi:hypothetical protein
MMCALAECRWTATNREALTDAEPEALTDAES